MESDYQFVEPAMFKKEEAKVKETSQKSQGMLKHYFSFKPGYSYRFRLIYLNPPGDLGAQSFCSGGFLNKHYHSIKNEAGERKSINCTTTFDSSSAGFKKCPFCTVASESKGWDAPVGSPAKILYSNIKRKFCCYALAYVVSDSHSPENNGKVKIIVGGQDLHKRLMTLVWGIDISTRKSNASSIEDSDEAMGQSAFNHFGRGDIGGHDFIVQVSQKGDFNDYSYNFSRKPSEIPVSGKDILDMCKEIDYFGQLTPVMPTVEQQNEIYTWALGETRLGVQQQVQTKKYDKPTPLDSLGDDTNATLGSLFESKPDVKKDPAIQEQQVKPKAEKMSVEDELDELGDFAIEDI